MSRRQVIDPTTVQAQFRALAQDKERLSSLVISADQERQKEEASLQILRSNHSILVEKTRIVSSNLGTQQKKKSMLQEEIQRFNRVIEHDTLKLKQLSEEMVSLEKDETERKRQFVKDMDELNAEMVDTLRRTEEGKLDKVLNLSFCRELEQFLDNKVESLRCEHDETAGEMELAKWIDIADKFHGSVEKLSDQVDKLVDENDKFRKLEEKVIDLREKVQNHNNEALESSELDELEHLWEQNYEVEDGGEAACIVGVDVDKQMNQENGGQRQQPVNMSLFYGDNSFPTGMDIGPLNEVGENDKNRNANASGIIINGDQDINVSTS